MEDVKSLTSAIQELSQVVKAMNKEQAPDMNPSELLEMFVQKQASLGVVDVSTQSSGRSANVYTSDLIIESGKEYRRKSHPALFAVVDYLETNESIRDKSVRKIAEIVTTQTGQPVGKSWAAVAKNYWQERQN